jgi:primosomal protein N'
MVIDAGRRSFNPRGPMVARVTLEIALRREFDYAIPRELAERIEVGTRVRVPFGHREVSGVVTANEPALHRPGRRAEIADHAQGAPPGPMDRRILLLPAGDGVEERSANGGPGP